VLRTAAKLEAAIFWKRDLLEDGHHEAERPALAALLLRQVEAVLQVGAELGVEGLLGWVHGEGLGVHPAPGEQRRAVRRAGVGLGAPVDYLVQPVALLHHLVRPLEQGRVQELDQHPEAEVIALVRRRGEQDQVPGVVAQRLGQLVVLGLAHLAAGAVRGQVMRLVEHHQVLTTRSLPPGPYHQVLTTRSQDGASWSSTRRPGLRPATDMTGASSPTRSNDRNRFPHQVSASSSRFCS
jgi:hypothetical protein